MSCRTRLLRHVSSVGRQPLRQSFTWVTASCHPQLRTCKPCMPSSKRCYSSSVLIEPPVGVRAVSKQSSGDGNLRIHLKRSGSSDAVQEDPNQDDDVLTLPVFWLRDICPCSQCQNPHSGQKNFATCDIDVDVTPASSQLKEDGTLLVEWSDGHSSVYPLEYYYSRYQISLHETDRTVPHRIPWDRDTFAHGIETRDVEYSDWMEGGPAFSQALQNLTTYGLIRVKNVPEADSSVQKVGERIGPIMDTFYGRTWDVVSKPDAENVAYTSEFLPLHQDLMYHNPVPKVQLLHCLKNECAGGDSLFSDGILAYWAMTRDLHRNFPGQQQDVLFRNEIAYWYTKNGNDRYRTHPIFRTTDPVHREGSVVPVRVPLDVHWSPPFQAPLPLGRMFAPRNNSNSNINATTAAAAVDQKDAVIQDWRRWVAFQRTFRDWIEAPDNMWQVKMQPGDCFVFDNTRVLHGRTQFDPSLGGQRHLRGCYLDEPTYDRARRQHVGPGLSLMKPQDVRQIISTELQGTFKILEKRGAGKDEDRGLREKALAT